MHLVVCSSSVAICKYAKFADGLLRAAVESRFNGEERLHDEPKECLRGSLQWKHDFSNFQGERKLSLRKQESKSKGNKFWFETLGGLINQRFEKPGFQCTPQIKYICFLIGNIELMKLSYMYEVLSLSQRLLQFPVLSLSLSSPFSHLH